MDERLEGLGEFVVARGDAFELLAAAEETLDQMAIFVKVPIERARTMRFHGSSRNILRST